MGYPKFTAPLTPCNLPVQRCPVPQKEAAARILIVRLGSHGDILMATPLLAALRRAFPNAHLTWIVETSAAASLAANPDIDELLVWDSRYWRSMIRTRGVEILAPKRVLGLRWLFQAFRMGAALRGRHYDTLISLQPEEWPTLLPGTGAATTIGVFDTFRQFSGAAYTSRYAQRYKYAYTFADLPEHRTDQYLLPLQALGLPPTENKQMVLGFTSEDAEAADQFLQQQGQDTNQPIVVLAPMTTWTSRNWPAERYVQLGDALAKQGRKIVLIGSPNPKEQAAVGAIAAQMQTPPMTALGTLSFRQMAALLARASLVISGDTGPMHVAAAVGTPYLALFGPTPVLGRAPQAGRGLSLAHAVPCGPCDKDFCNQSGENILRCLKLISVDEALAAAENLLAPGPQ
jgi:predicted lipopolysaccharide heptosyltransferase III